MEDRSQHGAIISIVIVIAIMIVLIISAGLYSYSNIKKGYDEDVNKPEQEPLKSDEQINIDETIIIDRKDLDILHEIGHGQFGSVHYGVLTVRSGRVAISVAIKMSSNIFSSVF